MSLFFSERHIPAALFCVSLAWKEGPQNPESAVGGVAAGNANVPGRELSFSVLLWS